MRLVHRQATKAIGAARILFFLTVVVYQVSGLACTTVAFTDRYTEYSFARPHDI